MADTRIFRVTYSNGMVKHVTRRVLGSIRAAHSGGAFWNKHPVKIEAAPQPEWEDVTAEFLTEAADA